MDSSSLWCTDWYDQGVAGSNCSLSEGTFNGVSKTLYALPGKKVEKAFIYVIYIHKAYLNMLNLKLVESNKKIPTACVGFSIIECEQPPNYKNPCTTTLQPWKAIYCKGNEWSSTVDFLCSSHSVDMSICRSSHFLSCIYIFCLSESPQLFGP